MYIIVQKFEVSKIFYLKKMNTFIQQGCIKLIKSDYFRYFSFIFDQINAVSISKTFKKSKLLESVLNLLRFTYWAG